MPEGRPIVGDCSTESRRVSDLIDYYLKPLFMKHPSYVKDSYDFITKIRNQNIPPNALIVTGDVTALYTNMCINRKRALARNPHDKYIIQLLELAMKNNDCPFNNEIFLQIFGMAMGKTFAPSLAHLYLLDFDNQAMEGFNIKPLLYYRFLDDIFFIWLGSMEELEEFEAFLTKVTPDITITLCALSPRTPTNSSTPHPSILPHFPRPT